MTGERTDSLHSQGGSGADSLKEGPPRCPGQATDETAEKDNGDYKGLRPLSVKGTFMSMITKSISFSLTA